MSKPFYIEAMIKSTENIPREREHMSTIETIAAQLGFALNDVKTIIHVLLQEADISVLKIEEMFKRHAWEQIALEAHSIKGSASNMQLSELTELSTALEIVAEQQDPQQVEMLINNIKSSLQQLHQQL